LRFPIKIPVMHWSIRRTTFSFRALFNPLNTSFYQKPAHGDLLFNGFLVTLSLHIYPAANRELGLEIEIFMITVLQVIEGFMDFIILSNS
jgi:hypothetical protein